MKIGMFLKVGLVSHSVIAARDVVGLKLFDLAGAETDFLVRQYRGRLGARNPGRPTTTRSVGGSFSNVLFGYTLS